jgi:hypothetical protein
MRKHPVTVASRVSSSRHGRTRASTNRAAGAIMIRSWSRNVTAAPSSSPAAAASRFRGPSGRQTRITSAAMISTMAPVSVSTYCSSTSCSGSNSTGRAATAASQGRAPERISTTYTSPAVASPARCCASGMSHRACSSITGMIATEYPLCRSASGLQRPAVKLCAYCRYRTLSGKISAG